MGLLETLHEERKERLKRIKEAAHAPHIPTAKPPRHLLIKGDLPFSNFDIILNEVCAYYKERPEDLLSTRRMHGLVQKRHILIYMLHRMTYMTNYALSEKINRDVSSIGYAINKIRDEMETHSPIIAILDGIIRPLLEERGRRVGSRT